MKIIIKDSLIVKKRKKIVFVALPTDITSVIVMGGQECYPPTFFVKLFKCPTVLRFIILVTNMDEVTLANHDVGFKNLIKWLGDYGWQMEAGISEAIEVPLMRTTVKYRIRK